MINNITSNSLAVRSALAVLSRTRACPTAGSGVHRWLFAAASRLREAGHDQRTSCAAIAKAVEHCGREVPSREIEDAVRSAHNDKRAMGPQWPTKNPELVANAVSNGVTVELLQSRSPVDAVTTSTDTIIDALFPGDAAKVLICAGTDQRDATTRRKAAYFGTESGYAFIVPNPMISYRAFNQNGKLSARCNANTGPRRFLVVESDPPRWDSLTPEEQQQFGTEDRYIAAKKDEAAAVLWHLAERATHTPLALVVDSGGKSLHGWFYVDGQSEEWCKKFFRFAVALGADPKLWTRCQLVRMPNGTRDNGKRQSVLFFNPNYAEVQ